MSRVTDERSVLEDRVALPRLGAARQFRRADLQVRSGRGQIARRRRDGRALAGFDLGRDTQANERLGERRGEVPVRLDDTARDTIACRGDDGVGQLVVVKDRAAAGRTTHDVDTPGPRLAHVDA
jgi:hypothetical protein